MKKSIKLIQFLLLLLLISSCNLDKNCLNLKKKYIKNVHNEPECTLDEVTVAINRWHFDVFPAEDPEAAMAYMIASQLDLVTYNTAHNLKKIYTSSENIDKKAKQIELWMSENLMHTRGVAVFSGLPGNSPWGKRGDNKAPDIAFKKPLPSEMKALSLYTQKITGMCYALANLMACSSIYNGVDEKNIMLIQMATGIGMHAVAIVKIENSYLMFNDKTTRLLTENELKNYLHSITWVGFFNHSIFYGSKSRIKPVNLGTEVFSHNNLQESIPIYANINSAIDYSHLKLLLKDREKLYDQVINNYEVSKLLALAKYAYQSLYVTHPEYYLKASLKSSVVKDLAEDLANPGKMLNWIKENISNRSIFYDYQDRIMTAEQVIIFKTGTAKDKGVALYALLTHQGYCPRLILSSRNAYICFNNKIISMKQMNYIKSINEKILIDMY